MLQNALLAGANSDPKKKPKAKTLQERERGLREWMLNLEARGDHRRAKEVRADLIEVRRKLGLNPDGTPKNGRKGKASPSTTPQPFTPPGYVNPQEPTISTQVARRNKVIVSHQPVQTREEFNQETEKIRQTMRKVRQQDPSIRSKNEAKLYNDTKTLEQRIRTMEGQGIDATAQRKQLSRNYSELKNFQRDPLYRSAPEDRKRYKTLSHYHDHPQDLHDRLVASRLDLDDLYMAGRQANKRGGFQNSIRINGQEVPDYDAVAEVAYATGLNRQDSIRLIKQKLYGPLSGRTLAVASRTRKFGGQDRDEAFTGPGLSPTKVGKQNKITDIVENRTGEAIKILRKDAPMLVTMAERRVRSGIRALQARMLQLQVGTPAYRQASAELKRLLTELSKHEENPLYKALPAENKNIKAFIRVMIDPETTAQRLRETNVNMADLINETSQLFGQGSHARANAQVETMDDNYRPLDEAYRKVGDAMYGLPPSVAIMANRGKLGKETKLLLNQLGKEDHLVRTANRGLSKKDIKILTEEAGLMDGVTSLSASIQQSQMLQNRDLGLISDPEAYGRFLWNSVSRPITTVVDGVRGALNGGHGIAGEERSAGENLGLFAADFLAQMLATKGLGSQGTIASYAPKLMKWIGLGEEAVKGTQAVQAAAKLAQGGSKFLTSKGLAGAVLKTVAANLPQMAVDSAIEARIRSNTSNESFARAFADSMKGQGDAIFTTRYLTDPDMGIDERIKGLIGQLGLASDFAHKTMQNPHALRTARKLLPNAEKTPSLAVMSVLLQKAAAKLPESRRESFLEGSRQALGRLAKTMGKAPLRDPRVKSLIDKFETDQRKALAAAGSKTPGRLAQDLANTYSVYMESIAKLEKISLPEAYRRYGDIGAKAVNEGWHDKKALFQIDNLRDKIAGRVGKPERFLVHPDDLLEHSNRTEDGRYKAAFTAVDMVGNIIYYNPETGAKVRLLGGPASNIHSESAPDSQDGHVGFRVNGPSVKKTLIRMANHTGGPLYMVALSPDNGLGSHGARIVRAEVDAALHNGVSYEKLFSHVNDAIKQLNNAKHSGGKRWKDIPQVYSLDQMEHHLSTLSAPDLRAVVRKIFRDGEGLLPSVETVVGLMNQPELMHHKAGDVVGAIHLDPKGNVTGPLPLQKPPYALAIPGVAGGLLPSTPLLDVLGGHLQDWKQERLAAKPEFYSNLSAPQWEAQYIYANTKYGHPIVLTFEDVMKLTGNPKQRDLMLARIRETQRERGWLQEQRFNNQRVNGKVKGTYQATTRKDGSVRTRLQYVKDAADASTGIHEAIGHVLFNRLPEQTKLKIANSLGYKEVNVAVEEKFVRGVEKFAAGGKVTDPRLKNAFLNFQKDLREVYADIKNSPLSEYFPVEIEREIKRLLGGNLSQNKGVGKFLNEVPLKGPAPSNPKEDDKKKRKSEPTARHFWDEGRGADYPWYFSVPSSKKH
ncbi:MAG: hypothetical protein BGO01_08900 [Armatimonadetes bacterium 55-13]|nr:hypothetical protein [Armatimonadota bacterium]OJU61979.1 MAG: hypothetical protein BGO01_08900 [Armatimonadetes bacterium 55-13]